MDQIDIKIGVDDFKFTVNTFHVLSGSSVLIGGGSGFRDVGGNGTNVVQIEGIILLINSSMSLTCNVGVLTVLTLDLNSSREHH